MKRAKVVVRPEITMGRIRPELYGHFSEHIGRCVYDGLWVSTDSEITNQGGIRSDTVDALRATKPPVLRWPGGCFADNYHWEDGIGPRESRPRRANVWWDQQDSNAFGTHEFLDLCERLGTAPYICLNVGSGTPKEALEWLEYCNYAGDSTLARRRAENGRSEPWGVRWWGVGNENWGCGGNFAARDYAKEYRRFTTYLRRFDGSARLIACGDTRGNWNAEFLDELRGNLNLVDHVSIHRYVNAGPGRDFSHDDYCKLMASVDIMEEDIRAAAGVIRSYTRNDRFIGVILDEWGVWHPEANAQTGYLQPNTLRDGLFAASALHMFHRHTDVLTMTNIAQTINVLQCLVETDGANIALTPTYHAYDMLKTHQNAEAIHVVTESPSVAYSASGKSACISALDIAASHGSDGSLTVSVVNRDPDSSIEAEIQIRGDNLTSVSGKVLTADAPDAVNAPGGRADVAPKDVDVVFRSGTIVREFPARSLTVFRIK